MTRCWQIELTFPNRTIKTFVYSDNGQDIKQRFNSKTCTARVLEEIDDPMLELKAKPKTEEKIV